MVDVPYYVTMHFHVLHLITSVMYCTKMVSKKVVAMVRIVLVYTQRPLLVCQLIDSCPMLSISGY